MQTFIVITPVFNDWPCLQMLVENINALPMRDVQFHVVAINDGSTLPETFDGKPLQKQGCVVRVETWNLICNLGNQKAISMGLANLEMKNYDFDAVIVMDSDGEDSPQSIPELIHLHNGTPQDIWVCTRVKRTENAAFKVGYFLYRMLFALLVGKVINFGNFSLIPKKRLLSLISRPELWQHYPSAIIRSRIPYHTIPSKRGQRYFGLSSQNLGNLLVHGLSGLSIFGETVYARIFFSLLGVSMATVIGIGAVIFVRYGTDWATPGWATDLIGNMVIFLGMIVLFMLLMSLQFLNMKMNVNVIPKLHFHDYIGSETLFFDRSVQ
ncbi:MAG: glycosyltransferase [Magnetococcales bacterium]|nr:glycosyltransferase [Magnetococcales bacterium]